MIRPKVLVAGHSHLGAIELAAAHAPDLEIDVLFYQFLRPDRPHIINLGGQWTYHPDCEREIRHIVAESQPDLIVYAIQGDQAIAAGLVNPEYPYEFLFPNESLTPSADYKHVVPYDMLFATCLTHYALLAQFLDRITADIKIPAIGLSAPPPVREVDLDHSHKVPDKDRIAAITKFGVASPRWRQRIWALHMRALAYVYGCRGIEFVTVPQAALDDGGLLADVFQWDLFHANRAYGDLVLQQIVDSLAHANDRIAEP